MVQRYRSALAAALLLALACASPAWAQTATGALTGHAEDEGKLVLPGVTVTITSPAMIGGGRTMVTDDQGGYRFTLLVPGTYRVSFELPGFSTLNIDSIDVGAGATMTINGTLKLGTLNEEVTVTSVAPTIDLQQATVGVNWSKQNMETLPWGKSLPSLVNMIPGLYATQYDVGASTMGGTAAPPSRTYGKTGGNVAMYEGVVFDQFFGDFGSYDEIQITSAAKGAEASSSGASFNFIVKSGGNQFHGSGTAAYQGDELQSNNVTQELLDRGLPPTSNKYTHYRDLKGDLSGKIINDKLWFYASYTDSYSGQYVSGFVSQKTGQPEVFYTKLFGPTARITYQINKKMKFDYVQQIARKWQPYRGADQFTVLEATTSQSYWGEVASAKWMYFPGQNTTADLAVNRAGTWNENGAWSDDVRKSDLTTTKLIGSANLSHSAPRRWQLNGSLSKFVALGGVNHEMKTGFLNFTDTTRSFADGYPGQELFRYRSVAGEADPFTHPDSVQVFDYPLETALGIAYHSFYANDKINATTKLTFNAGIRYDRYTSWLPEQGNPGTGPYATPKIYPEQRDGFPIYQNWSPRFSAAYDVFGNGHWALKASYGRYAGATSGSSPSPGPSASSVNPASVITKTYNNWDGSIPYVPIESNLGSTTGGGGTQRLDTNLTALVTDEFTVGTEFGTRAYLMRLNVVRKIDIGGSKTLDLAMPYEAYTDVRSAVDPGHDNIVGTADDGVMYAWSVPRSYPTFGQVNKLITNLADGEGGARYTAYEATFSKQYSKGWSFLASGTADVGRTINPNPQNPNEAMYNWSFPKWNYAVKMNATYALPLGVTFSTNYNAQSGEYYSRSAQMRNALNTLVTVVVEGNAGRYDWVKIWDNRITKSFKVGGGKTLQASLDIYNTMNASTVLSQVNTNGPDYLKPSAVSQVAATATAILPPRILRLTARYMF